MNYLVESLEKIGLTDKQAKVYLAALELGSATIQELARKSGVKRPSIYNFLDEMINKGFLTMTEIKGKTHISPEKPESIIEKQKRQANMMNNLLPDLLGIYNSPAEKPKIKFYEGFEGIKKVYDNIITDNQPIYAFGDYEILLSSELSDHMKKWTIERAQRNIPIKIIAKEGPKIKAYLNSHDQKKELRETKFAKNAMFSTEINIFGDKVALISFQKPGMGVIIENKNTAETMMSIWQLLWNNLS